jgi:hypothetical protein
MAMYVTVFDMEEKIPIMVRTWYVGHDDVRSLPDFDLMVYYSRRTDGIRLEVQADGHELQRILESFENIPRSRKPVMVWSGEIAGFILRNL